jgi:uncharacterized protein YndB with AHSA1/START domain
MEAQPLVVEQTYNAPISRVWEAITDYHKMQEWYFKMEDFKPEVGFKFSFTGSNKGKTYLHLCEVTEVIPGKKLGHTWTYKDYPGEAHVTWELFDEGDNKTRLRLTHTGLETFKNDEELPRENFVKGWTHITGTSLKNFLEK